MTPDHLPILRAAAAQDPTATIYVEIPVEFDPDARSLADGEVTALQDSRFFKKWSDKT